MRSKVFNTLLFCICCVPVSAQYKITGKVANNNDSTVVRDVVIYLNDGKRSAISDNFGRFEFNDLASGVYVLHINNIGNKYKKTELEIKNTSQHVTIYLEEWGGTLDEVQVTEQRTDFGFTRMKGVEGLAIYEGKKTEVIIPEQMITNMSTNNARQVYSRVAGLNIWENDGAGLQLSIGGRGLDPNRSSNFNVRQNGYDISADALGYPESYYTPPVEGLGRVQIIRGAASLQYGTQFGGLINFEMKKPVTYKKIEVTARQSIGSFGFYNAFTSASGTIKKLSYYTFYQYKKNNGWRDNSTLDNQTIYANVNYAITDRTKIGIDYTGMGYLSQQPGGLSDDMFKKNPRQTNRERNWFKVGWNLFALHLDHTIDATSEINVRVFGLSAYRFSVGFRPNRVESVDDNSERDLIKGYFTNWGAEARYLKRYNVMGKSSVLLAGGRYYHGFNHSQQGLGSTGKGPDFNFINPEQYITYDYTFPNRNASGFIENIFHVSKNLSITPGIRFEYINTKADGYYGTILRDLAGNVIEITRTEESRVNERHFFLGGIGVSYKPAKHVNIYSNVSQNYRSITFSDMNISNPSLVIDPNMQDEKGYSVDLGIRSEQTTLISYDVSAFFLNYNNRIGEVQFADANDRVYRKRGNIGQAIIYGLESYGEADVLGIYNPSQEKWTGVIFANLALIHSNYHQSELTGVEGNEVEFVPALNLKTGVRVGYKNLKGSFQFTHLSDQYSDARNSVESDPSAVIGLIPAYSIMDLSLSYQWKFLKAEASVNNLANQMYFTRRATGYPGPGIIPSDGRGFYFTLQVKI
jgi:Fe(3+) dicitrate transport protein